MRLSGIWALGGFLKNNFKALLQSTVPLTNKATRLGFTPGDLFTGVVQIDLSESLDFPDIRVIREAALENDVPQVEVLTGRIINSRLESFLRARAADGLDFHGGVVEYLGDVDGLPTFSILY